MADFSHLKALEVSIDNTVDYPIHQITVNGLTPTLIVAPATEVNKPYFNSLLKKAGKASRAVKAGAINAGMIDENREEEKVLYPKFVIKGWRDMVDGSTGKATDFSVVECTAFLTELPNWLFDDIRTFCSNPANFTEIMDVELKAGN